MKLLNFSHPVTDVQKLQVEEITGNTVDEVRTIPVQINQEEPLEPQVTKIVDAAGFTPEEWQTTPFIINPAGMSTAALAIVAEIHGRCGFFPRSLSLVRKDGGFAVSQIVDLQTIREQARTRR